MIDLLLLEELQLSLHSRASASSYRQHSNAHEDKAYIRKDCKPTIPPLMTYEGKEKL